MKNKLTVLILIGIFCLNIKLLYDNYRLNKEYKLAYISAISLGSEVPDGFKENNNLEHMDRLIKLSETLDIKELKNIDISSDYLVLRLEVSDIERLKEIETAISKELDLGLPEMEIYFEGGEITGLLKYRGDRL